MDRVPVVSAVVLATVLATVGAPALDLAPKAVASPAWGNFAGLVDIGGRSLYLECRGQGSPTVILESGAGGRADVWTRDLQERAGTRTMVPPASRRSPVSAPMTVRARSLSAILPSIRPGRCFSPAAATRFSSRAPPKTGSTTCTPCWAPPRSPVPTCWSATPRADFLHACTRPPIAPTS